MFDIKKFLIEAKQVSAKSMTPQVRKLISDLQAISKESAALQKKLSVLEKKVPDDWDVALHRVEDATISAGNIGADIKYAVGNLKFMSKE